MRKSGNKISLTLDIMEALSICHARHDGWLYFHEMRTNEGLSGRNGFIDGFAIQRYGSKMHETISYEVKVSRSDFLSDIKNPKKQERAKALSNRFYYVINKDVCSLDEIPEWAGLLIYRGDKECQQGLYAGLFEIARRAPNRERNECPWEFAAALACARLSNATAEALEKQKGITND